MAEPIKDIFITCPKCHMTSHNPNDVKFGWCAKCEVFIYALDHQGPINFNAIVSDLQKRCRRDLGAGAPFSLQFEQFSGSEGVLYWRAIVKLGSRLECYSHREHVTPTDALRELDMLLEEKADRRRL